MNNRLKAITIALIFISLTVSCGFIEITSGETPPPETVAALTTTPTPINPTWTPPVIAPNQTMQLPSIADVVAVVKPGVVAINTQVVTLDFFNRPFSQKGAGSGWIIDPDGIIVTNNHVIEDARTITVKLDDGRTFDVDPKSIYTDPLNDLAIIRINAQNLPALRVDARNVMRVGEWVVTIGNSLGLGISAKEGIISRKGVSLNVDQGQTLYDLLEISAAINPGNSGGPLVSMAGQVIGITSAKISTVGVEGMGYAINTSVAMPIIQQLIKNGYVIRPYIGVGLYTVDQFAVLRYRLAVKKGVLLTQVVANGPAAKGGLQEGDVVVSANGKDVATAEDLSQTIRSSRIGQPMDITYYRGDVQKNTQVTPIESPPPS